jgi:hypothetical protein
MAGKDGPVLPVHETAEEARERQGAALGSRMSDHKFDEYKLFFECAQHLSERRQGAIQTYFSVNTTIFAILALLVKEVGLAGPTLVAVSLPLFLVGGVACVIWQRIMTQYRELIGWRYEQFKAMEREMPGARRCASRSPTRFSSPAEEADARLFAPGGLAPAAVLTLYVVYAAGLVGVVGFGLDRFASS